jgi:superfamily I DNA/RNA helicase
MVAAAERQGKARFNRKAIINGRKWSEYQQDLFDVLMDGDGHVLVRAAAGSGKSTAIVGAVAHLPSAAKIAVVAFNVHSVDELGAKLPSSVSCSTAHKFGLSALVRYFGGSVFRPNDTKYRDLCRQGVDFLIKEMADKVDRRSLSSEIDFFLFGHESRDSRLKAECKAMRRSASIYLESVIHFGMASLSDWSLESLLQLDDHFVIEKNFCSGLTEELLKFVPRIMERGLKDALEKQNISLDELLYLPVTLGLRFPAYDFVFMDECQDGSRVMHALVGLMGASGRVCFVGDEDQAVQGFAGSDAYSIDRLIEEFKPKQLPLSICYRCPSSHLDLARRFVPTIQNRPNAPIGHIETVHPDSVVSMVEQGDLLICRFTAPLVSYCLTLIAAGKKAMVRGRDIGKQLAAMVDGIECKFPGGFEKAITGNVMPRLTALKEAEKDSEAQSLEDRFGAVMTCFDAFGRECQSKAEFVERIQGLFCGDDDRPPIILATIHRSKGDEADRVFILGSNFLPYTHRSVHEWQAKQERNLTYVALTRSKSDLFLVPMGKSDAIVDAAMAMPYGGIELPESTESCSSNAFDPNWKNPSPELKSEAVKRIEERWNAFENNQATFTPPSTSSIHAVAAPMPIYTIGQLVALYHNPRNAGKIVALSLDSVTVQRSNQEPITVPLERIKPLIPQK